MRLYRFLLLSLVSVFFITSCSLLGSSEGVPSNALTISIAYSPEKTGWLSDRINAFNAQRNKVNGQTIYVEGIEQSSGAARTNIKTGQLKVTIWSPSASTWLEVLKQETNNPNIAASNRPLVLTPVVIGMWKPMAEAMGWPETPIGWSDMLELSNDPEGWGRYGHPEWGRFSWGHTDPEISTTALSTLIAEFYAATGKQSGLTVSDVQKSESQQFIRSLGKSIKHYGYNTLIFSDNMKKFGMSYISAFPMEEITLIEFNKNNPPATPLVAIYPKEGTFWHDDPFIVLASASEAERQAADQFYNFLLNEESQKLAMSYGFRPANASVALADPISPNYGVQPTGVQNLLESPPADVIVAVKNSWLQNRKRADIMLVVDTSGSMEGEKLELVKAGIETFLMRILPEDRVGLITFDTTARVIVEAGPLSENRIALQNGIQAMRANGKTAVYDALQSARDSLNALPPTPEEPDRIRGIVLLSDGQDNASALSLEALAAEFEESGVSIFPVAYGDEADIDALQKIADFSRTQVVIGSTGNIAEIFENLSRYF
jgi:Mg-chelatase subunit ChlD